MSDRNWVSPIILKLGPVRRHSPRGGYLPGSSAPASLKDLEDGLLREEADDGAAHATNAVSGPPDGDFFSFASEATPLSEEDEAHLTRAAALRGDAARGAWQRLGPTVTLDALPTSLHRLLPTLYPKLTDWYADPADIAAAKRCYLQAWWQNHRLLSATRGVLEALRNEGVEFLLLKGVALVPLYYESDWGRRYLRDINVWVRSADRSRAAEVLEREGWESIYPGSKFDRISRIVHGGAFRKTGVGEIDLHWHLALPCCWDPSDDDFWNASVPVDVDGFSSRTLCPTDQIFHACVHAEVSRVYNDDDGMQWAVDTLAILDRAGDAVDWDRMVELARDRQLVLAVRDALETLKNRLGARVPESALATLRELRPGRAERLERASLRRHRVRVRRLLNLASQYLRLRRAPYFRSIVLGPLRFLGAYWNLEGTLMVVPRLLRKGVRNLWALVRGR